MVIFETRKTVMTMSVADANSLVDRLLTTPDGRVSIEGPVSGEYLETLEINKFLSNFRVPARQKEALILVANSPEGQVYIARNQNEIVGYVSFHYPSEYTRWSRHPRILELGAIEVSREWQRKGIGYLLLKAAYMNKIMEEYVVITTEFYWHWDLKGCGLSVWEYRKMLVKLFGSVDFKRRRTDDPEILEHPANMLMVRFGSKIPESYVKAFEDLTYQNSLIE